MGPKKGIDPHAYPKHQTSAASFSCAHFLFLPNFFGYFLLLLVLKFDNSIKCALWLCQQKQHEVENGGTREESNNGVAAFV